MDSAHPAPDIRQAQTQQRVVDRPLPFIRAAGVVKSSSRIMGPLKNGGQMTGMLKISRPASQQGVPTSSASLPTVNSSMKRTPESKVGLLVPKAILIVTFR